jgi:hypothetical protein
MIKVPGTPAGLTALEELTAEGINVNVTLLFSVATYEQVARAYVAGINGGTPTGQPLDAVASVASFFVSRIDTAVDRSCPRIALAGPHRDRHRQAGLPALPGRVRGRAVGAARRGGRLASSGRCGHRPARRTPRTPTPTTSRHWSGATR